MKKRIGILTFFRSINNGAFLQAYSLWKILSERYADTAIVEMVDYDSRIANNRYKQGCREKKNKENYKKFAGSYKSLKLSAAKLITDDLCEAEIYLKGLCYDIVVVGSDEVWKTDGMRGFPNAYWLNFDLKKTKRVAYAVSGRNDYRNLSELEKNYIREAVRKFVYVGVRDRITRNEIMSISGIESYENCDPTILNASEFQVRPKELEIIKKKRGVPFNKKIVLLILYERWLAEQLYRMLSGEFYVISTFDYSGGATDQDFYAQSPFEWQELIAVSDMVITSLFHGTLFSVIHNRKFVSIEFSMEGRGKIEDFLDKSDLKEHCIYAKENVNSETALGMKVFTKARKMIYEDIQVSYDTVISLERERASSFFREMDMIIHED